MQYFREGGWHLPDGEAHLQKWMTQVNDRRDGRLLYQGKKYRAALDACGTRRGTAIDIGAHVGLWSWQMAKDFHHVLSFEPMPAHQACFIENMKAEIGSGKVALFTNALGNKDGEVLLRTRTPGSSGDTGVEPVEAGPGAVPAGCVVVPIMTLDCFFIKNVDFIKIDCEGYEAFVLEGAKKTILEWKPTIIVEQKPETGGAKRYGIGTTDAVKFLQSLGMRQRAAIQGDYIMTW